MTKTLTKDPVCGMNVETTADAAGSDFKGQTYHFCCSGCKKKFDQAPDQYLSRSGDNRQRDKSGCCCS
jgi:Cu+-exporting ATPase